MKKIKLMLVSFLMLAVHVQGQSTEDAGKGMLVPSLSEGSVMYDKTQVPCYTAEMPVPEDVAKDAIKKRFKQLGSGSKERNGFMEFRNVSRPDIKNGNLVDAYVKVERKSKKEKNISLVSMIITDPGVLPGGQNPQEIDAGAAAAASVGAFSLLSSLSESSSDHGLELEIKKQEELVKKADKNYNNLVSDGEDLQGKLKKTQNEIETNRNDQVKMAEELKKQKETLLQMQSRRRTGSGEKMN